MAQESNLPSLQELVASVSGANVRSSELCECWPGTRRFLNGLLAATDNAFLKEAIQLTIDLGNEMCGIQWVIENYSPIGLKFETKPDKDKGVRGIQITSAEPSPSAPTAPDGYSQLTVLHTAYVSGYDENGCKHDNSGDTHTDIYVYTKNIP
ncbi:MAG: hypothetical protein WB615_16315 [Candidatus Tumulicola sp.]